MKSSSLECKFADICWDFSVKEKHNLISRCLTPRIRKEVIIYID